MNFEIDFVINYKLAYRKWMNICIKPNYYLEFYEILIFLKNDSNLIGIENRNRPR